MKKSIFFAIISFITFAVHSQTFSWGFPFAIPDETDKEVTHVIADQLYRISSYYDLAVFNRKVIVDQFSLSELEKTKTIDLSVEQPPMGLASLTLHSLFQKEGTQFVFFYTEFDRSDKKYKLLSREVDIRTGKMGTLKPIVAMDDKNANFLVSQSDDHSKYAVVEELPFEKKATEKIELILLDANQNIMSQKLLEFPFEDKRDKQHTLFVSNNGQIIVIKKIDEKKEKPYLNMYVWNSDKENVQTHSLKQEDNFQIPQFQGKFIGDKFYFMGVLTHEKSGTFGLKIDMNGRNSGVPGNGILISQLNADGNVDYTQRNDFDVVTNLNLKNVIFGKDQFYAIYDRMFVEKKSKGSNIGQQGFSYDYTYLNNGYLIQGFDVATGSLQWSQIIDTAEPNTTNDNGSFLSTLSYLDGDNLVLLYNETRDLNKGKIHQVFNRRFPIKEVISPTGETLSQEALLAAGIGVTKEEQFELDTQFIIPVTPKKYIIRASNRTEYKYGFMQL